MTIAPNTINLRLTPRRVALTLLCITGVLLLLSIPASYYHLNFGKHAAGARTVGKFHLDREMSIPAVYNAFLLFSSGLLLLMHSRVARQQARTAMKWGFRILGGIFIFVTFDELCGLHELVGRFLQNRFNWGGVLYFAWTAAIVPPVIVLGLIYIPFVRALPRRIALLTLAAATIYLGGAVGIEMVSAKVFSIQESTSFGYEVLVHIEEVCEQVGLTVFIYALLRLHHMERNRCEIAFDTDAVAEPAADRNKAAKPEVVVKPGLTPPAPAGRAASVSAEPAPSSSPQA